MTILLFPVVQRKDPDCFKIPRNGSVELLVKAFDGTGRMFRKICDGLKSLRRRALFGSKCTVFKTVPFPELFPPGLHLALKGPVMAKRMASRSNLRD